MHSSTPPPKMEKIGLKERAEIVVVRRFLTYEWGCGPHCGVRSALWGADRTANHCAGGLEA